MSTKFISCGIAHENPLSPRYDGPVELDHPIDAGLRERLKTAKVNQADFARALGRSQGWLNKYMHGAGNATIDDVVRMLALLIGVEVQPLSALERRLLKAFRSIEEGVREDAAAVMENVARGFRRAPSQESDAPAAHTNPPKASRARGTRKAAGG